MKLLRYCISACPATKNSLRKLLQQNTHINKSNTATNKIDFICLRINENDNSDSSDLEGLTSYYAQITKKYKRKNQIKKAFCKNIQIAKKFRLDGVHLKSFEVSKIKQAKRAKLKCIISCHNKQQIRQAIICKGDYITYSPVFESKGRSGFGSRHLRLIAKKSKQIKILALGGIISPAHIKRLQPISTKHKQNLHGFGSIRYFT